MTRWEYAFVTHLSMPMTESERDGLLARGFTGEIIEDVSPFDPDRAYVARLGYLRIGTSDAQQFTSLVECMAKLGSDGWELSGQSGIGGGLNLIFRRPLPETTGEIVR